MKPSSPLLVVAGPTASGKSALALDIAREVGGVVINADSMQVYRELRVVTARPSVEEEALAPHRLYGVLPGAEVCSAGRWAEMAAAEVRAAWDAGLVPILCGGTGLYIHALTVGLSPIPPVPDAVRTQARADMAALGNATFHARLAAADPVMGGRLNVGDTQRTLRAWEVLQATGRSLAAWQEEPPVRLIEARPFTLLLEPPRDVLYGRCDRRFAAMMEQGALEEVRALDALGLPEAAPVMKALGVPELRRHLHGACSLDAAVAKAQQTTRNFAKRQGTWFRGQLRADVTVDAQYSESLKGEIFSKVRHFLLTGET
ncbi:tRNA (adenosine(37)-N6)-dimethylallyltransferase MiaA [Novispirillum sp. DQ9]|uniref:tRNA (adenosine(37)-N6)-dimethylallyltransferase MiaA n=1 Tax=Novispirillum sp. DQ9 TaxID=3398612 RepID=UPI003C7AE43D